MIDNIKREFDCDTCAWYENGQCTHVNKNAYYPCPDWLRHDTQEGNKNEFY